jgi:xanthosine utilization system XapX-like protein
LYKPAVSPCSADPLLSAGFFQNEKYTATTKKKKKKKNILSSQAGIVICASLSGGLGLILGLFVVPVVKVFPDGCLVRVSVFAHHGTQTATGLGRAAVKDIVECRVSGISG